MNRIQILVALASVIVCSSSNFSSVAAEDASEMNFRGNEYEYEDEYEYEYEYELSAETEDSTEEYEIVEVQREDGRRLDRKRSQQKQQKRSRMRRCFSRVGYVPTQGERGEAELCEACKATVRLLKVDTNNNHPSKARHRSQRLHKMIGMLCDSQAGEARVPFGGPEHCELVDEVIARVAEEDLTKDIGREDEDVLCKRAGFCRNLEADADANNLRRLNAMRRRAYPQADAQSKSDKLSRSLTRKP